MGWSNGTLLFMAAAGSTGQDLWTVPVSSLGVPTGKPVPLIQTPFNDLPGRVSPDGRWIAYSSNESGTNEVYVAPTSGTSGVKWQISTGRGTSVEWRGDSRELYYRDDAGIVAVDVHAEGTRFEAGLPKRLISVILAGPRSTFAVTNDGQKFLAIRAREVSEAAPLTLVVNWRPQKR
jgi:eukaryotic-like serine/threonine-protein kinase